jgi:hypothetical protein
MRDMVAREQRLPPRLRKPRHRYSQLLAWADAHRRRTGRWPNRNSGPVAEAPTENWCAIDQALRDGRRGLPGGESIAQLLARRRPARNKKVLPRLTIRQIVEWAKAHRRRTGRLPAITSGAVHDAPGESWQAIHAALERGVRGLRGGDTLTKILAQYCGARRRGHTPRLTIRKILAWADAYHRRHGSWPHANSGAIPGVRGETWLSVNEALYMGWRGLERGSSLARLLDDQRGVRNRARAPRLTREDILRWARAHRQRTGRWPTSQNGPIPEAPGDTWAAVDGALRHGSRGLDGGYSLPRLLYDTIPDYGRCPHRRSYRRGMQMPAERDDARSCVPGPRQGQTLRG